MITVNDLVTSFQEYANKYGYPTHSRSGLITEYFENDFSPSAGHQYVMPVLLSDSPLPSRTFLSISESCFRRVDIGKLGFSPYHLLLFEMGVLGILGEPTDRDDSLRRLIETAVSWLKSLGFEEKALIFSVSAGADVLGSHFEADESSRRLLLEGGISSSNIFSTVGRRNFMYSRELSRPAGYSIEIFARAETGLVEIGSFNIYSLLFNEGQLHPSANIAIGCGFGFERIAFILNRLKSVFALEPLARIAESIKEYTNSDLESQAFEERFYVISELIRSATFIIAEGQKPDQTGRGRILKRLLRTLHSELVFLNISSTNLIQSAVNIIEDAYRVRYPLLTENKSRVLSTLLEAHHPIGS